MIIITISILFRYRWEKNGKPFSWQVYDTRISQQPGRGSLVITNPQAEDTGIVLQSFFTFFLDFKLKCLFNLGPTGTIILSKEL